MAIITYPLNDIEYGAAESETYLSTRISGIYSAEGQFEATVTGAREITISGGLAWIRNGDFKGKSIAVTASEIVTLATADGAMPRIDVLVLRFSQIQNSSEFAILQGVPSSSPVPPSLTKSEEVYELGLYLIQVPASSVEVLSSHLTSVKLDENYCGLMRDGVTSIPTQDLQDEFNALIQAMREEYGEAGELAEEYMPHIGDNGNWYLGETDTGVYSRGDKGDKGDAYVLTSQDKSEIASIVLQELPVYNGEVVS